MPIKIFKCFILLLFLSTGIYAKDIILKDKDCVLQENRMQKKLTVLNVTYRMLVFIASKINKY